MPGWINILFCNICNTPDIVFINEGHRDVLIVVIGHVFNLYLNGGPVPAVNVSELGYGCRLMILISGSLGYVYGLLAGYH